MSYDLLVREQHEPAVRRAIINSTIIRQDIGDMNPVHKLSWIAPVKHCQRLIAADARNSFSVMKAFLIFEPFRCSM